MSTTKQWTRFTFVLLKESKNIQTDNLFSKTERLDNNEKLQMKLAKATFMTLIGGKTVEILHPKDKVSVKNLKWTKTNWEKIWKETANENHQLVQLLKAKREQGESVLDFSNELTRLTTDCKLDTDVISALIIAVFAVSVEDEEIVKAVEEKLMKHKELSEKIAKFHKTN